MALRSPGDFDVGEPLRSLCERVDRAGGRLLVVGGWVRDSLLGRTSKDIDLELHGLSVERARALFAESGTDVRRLDEVGRAFPVWLLQLADGTSLEIGLADDPEAAPNEAAIERHARTARRRDLRINALAFDPIGSAVFDTVGGREDLENRMLRCVDAERFGEDPLRALRVARFAAQLDFDPDDELAGVCARQSLGDVAVERVFVEWQRLLFAADPAHGLEVLARTGVRANFEVLEALEGVPQDARWHPEGCVWTHTVMVVREAARLRHSGHSRVSQDIDDEVRERDLQLMWGALCHDLGKPGTTTIEPDAIRSPAHDALGETLTRDWLGELQAPNRTLDAVAALVRWHLSPGLLVRQESGDRAYRRLARRLAASGVDAELLCRVARADHLGRTTEDALAGDFSSGDAFLARMEGLDIVHEPPAEIVRGRDVIAAGVPAGPAVGRILERCRDIHDETGWTDAERVLARALEEDAAG